MSGPEISVKEYAARHGMTEQAVYKQIKAGKLQAIERREGGKLRKYISPAPERAQERPPAAPAAPDHDRPAAAATPQAEPPHVSGTDTTPERAPDQSAAALSQAIAALTAQLAEKDKQIARLQELLNQSQQLQAHSQRLLEQGPERATDIDRQPAAPDVSRPDTQPAAQDQRAAAAPDPIRPAKKRGFWAWLFGAEE